MKVPRPPWPKKWTKQGRNDYYAGVRKRLRMLRARRYLTTRELADRTGTSQQTVWNYEWCGRLPPHLMGRYARALGCSIEEILGETPIRPLTNRVSQRLLKHVEDMLQLTKWHRSTVCHLIEALRERHANIAAEAEKRRRYSRPPIAR